MAISAFVNPDGLKSIESKIGALSQDLTTVSNQLTLKTENLNQSGFKDKKFSELKDRIDDSKDDIKNLKIFMDKFQMYIQEQEKLIRKYLNSQTMKSGKL